MSSLTTTHTSTVFNSAIPRLQKSENNIMQPWKASQWQRSNLTKTAWRIQGRIKTVFRAIKSELIWTTIFQIRQQAQISIGHYIEAFYDPKCRRPDLGYKSFIQFEVQEIKLDVRLDSTLHFNRANPL